MEEKVFRDPIHGYVRVNNEVIWKSILSREVQRMKRIKQLGSTSCVYHAGEHSRFAHSLGVYEIVRRMVNEVEDLRNTLTDYEKLTVMLAGLLHDIGHAPFSHSFESIMSRCHEEYTAQLIRSDSDISKILAAENPNLPDDVAKVIEGTHPNQILCQLVSSQLDADRMDYLLRDSYFTGTKYGEFDLERVLRTLRVRDNKVVVKESGMHTIEDYIMARYHMYWQVYYHPVSRSFDALLIELFKRLKNLYIEDHSIITSLPMYKDLLENEVMSNEQYYQLDDCLCWYSFNLMEKLGDPILADLAKRITSRNLFKYDRKDNYFEIQKACLEKGFDPEYYLHCDIQKQSPYHPYSQNAAHSIWILLEDDSIRELTSVSRIVSSICENTEKDEKIFYPKEILQ